MHKSQALVCSSSPLKRSLPVMNTTLNLPSSSEESDVEDLLNVFGQCILTANNGMHATHSWLESGRKLRCTNKP